MIKETRIAHPFPPIYNKDSKRLILGTFPSVKSRENAFYYGHPQNRFWRVLAAVYEEDVPVDNQEKTAFLYRHHIALWDVLAACEIKGSADSSIKKPQPNDLLPILQAANITEVYANGKKALALYDRYQYDRTKKKATVLPSTSPANAAWSMERLIEAWQVIKENK